MSGEGREKRAKLPLQFQFLAAWIGVWVGRRQQDTIDYLLEENQALREKIGRGRLDLSLARRRRLGELGKKLGRKRLAQFATLGTPDTILRWYRDLVARKYDGSERRGPGRPRTKVEIAQLVLKMATENPKWGYARIQGALKNIGFKIGRSTVRAIVKERGIDPAPNRGKRTPWSTFLKAHMGRDCGGRLLHGGGRWVGEAGTVLRVLRDRHCEQANRDRWNHATA